MDHSRLPLNRAIGLLGYGLLGTVTTGLVGLVVLNLAEPIQAVVYDLVYLRIGPTTATELAILVHFLLAVAVALAAAMLAGDAISDRGANGRAIGLGTGAMLALVVAFIVVVLAGLTAFLAALLLLAAGLIAVPLGLRYRLGVRSGALPAFVGAIPVVVLLVFLAGFGLGWGWGYIVTAEAVPSSAVDGPVAPLEEVPEVRDDLLVDGDCEPTDEGERCTLQLRGYEHERSAIQFMADHGVRCPYQNTHTGETQALFVRHDGTYYRVTCSPHGD